MVIHQVLYLFIYGGLTLLILFTLTWLIQLKTKNAGIVDTLWAASFPILVVIYAFLSNGNPTRLGMIVGMVTVAGARLAVYLFVRTIGTKEDARYTALREKWGASQNILMLRFFYFQAILALILSLPFALIVLNPDPQISWIEILGVIIWAVGVIGEAIADSQLKNFKAHSENHGKVCTVGIWNYSRHPNYFFQWLMWVAYFVTALGSPWGWLSILSPLLMLYFLLKVTGIVYTEEHLVKSRGAAYVEYQKTTSAFVPIKHRQKK